MQAGPRLDVAWAKFAALDDGGLQIHRARASKRRGRIIVIGDSIEVTSYKSTDNDVRSNVREHDSSEQKQSHQGPTRLKSNPLL